MRAVAGLVALLALAWLLSEDRRRVPWRAVAGGLVLQLGLAVVLTRFAPAADAFALLNSAVDALQRATDAGTVFVFGYLGGGAAPFVQAHPEAGFILAFRALPLVLVISALAALGFYWGILQRITQAFAWLLRRTMGISGPLALGAAVHIFVGMIEAPLLVRPYLARMQRGELFALMTCGMAGIAGTVMAIYAAILDPVVPGALRSILTASVISTPAALAVAALMVPFQPVPRDDARLVQPDRPASVMDAIVRGAGDGIGPLVNIVVMLLVAVALVALVDMALALVPTSWLPHWLGPALTLQALFALPFTPVMWLIGIPWAQAGTAAALMAHKTVLNEFVAYLDLAHLPPGALDARSRRIVTYALCGFANFGSLGIMIGGLGAMVPERRPEVVALGLRSILSGTIATCMSGALAGLL
jgi:CNT family concentrative nucleoside transporter